MDGAGRARCGRFQCTLYARLPTAVSHPLARPLRRVSLGFWWEAMRLAGSKARSIMFEPFGRGLVLALLLAFSGIEYRRAQSRRQLAS